MIIQPENRILNIQGKPFKDNIPNYRKLSTVLDFPGPVQRYYNWPSIYEAPMEEQIATVDFLLKYRRGYCLNAIGTGKTLCMDWIIDFLIDAGEEFHSPVRILGKVSPDPRGVGDKVKTQAI